MFTQDKYLRSRIRHKIYCFVAWVPQALLLRNKGIGGKRREEPREEPRAARQLFCTSQFSTKLIFISIFFRNRKESGFRNFSEQTHDISLVHRGQGIDLSNVF